MIALLMLAEATALPMPAFLSGCWEQKREGGGWTVALGDGSELQAKALVVAHGNQAPDTPDVAEGISDRLFVNDPWSDSGRAAVERAAAFRVLRTQGIESEAPLAFAALQRLLRPVLHLADRLPEPQTHALRVALGEEAGDDADRFLVFLGTLNLLADAADEAPVLAVVE